jgi:hypothetical protein
VREEKGPGAGGAETEGNSSLSASRTKSPKPSQAYRGRRNAGVATVFAKLRRGQALTLEFTNHGALWRTSDGRKVNDRIARAVINDAHVLSVDVSLFPSELAQTWRYLF